MDPKLILVILMPILIFVLYFLMFLNKKQQKSGQLAHFEIKDITEQEKTKEFNIFSPKRIILPLIIFALLVFIYYSAPWDPFLEFFIGFVVVILLTAIGEQFSAQLSSLWVMKHPDSIEGKVIYKKKYLFMSSAWVCFRELFVLLFVAIISGSMWAWGGFVAVVFFMAIKYIMALIIKP